MLNPLIKDTEWLNEQKNKFQLQLSTRNSLYFKATYKLKMKG